MDFFSGKAFQAMEAGLQALEMQSKIVAQNIANSNTPGYKTKSLAFQEVLNGEMEKGDYRFRVQITTDETTTSRMDGNNVDLDAENLKALKMKYQQAYLVQKISGQFRGIRTVLENGPR